MTIAFNCPTCGNRFEVGDNMAGQKGQCTCGSVFIIPGERRAAPARPSLRRSVPVSRPAAVVEEPVLVAQEVPAEPRKGGSWLFHVLPCLLLMLVCTGIGLRDYLLKDQEPQATAAAPVVEEPPAPIDPRPWLSVQFHDRDLDISIGKTGFKAGPDAEKEERTPAVWEPSMRFGLLMRDPRFDYKKLTFHESGLTNNTCVRLDNHEWLFGEKAWRGKDGQRIGDVFPGRWVDRDVDLGSDPSGRKRIGKKSIWMYDEEKVQITQIVEVVPGSQARTVEGQPGPPRRRLDTCVVRYQIENLDSEAHKVGLRFLLDTFIGSNDGVPFTIPSVKDNQLCDTEMDFSQPSDVPDFIQALEKENLARPGTIALVQFKIGGSLEPPDRVTLGAWPNIRLSSRDSRCLQERTKWEVPVLPIKMLTPADSAVVMYWDERRLQPGETRKVGFAYGLGSVASSEDEGRGQLGLSVSGSFVRGGQFTLTAYVSKPVPGQSLTLTLPLGFSLVQGAEVMAVPPVPAGVSTRNSVVSWRIKARDQPGKYSLKVRSSTGISQTQPVTISGTPGIFD